MATLREVLLRFHLIDSLEQRNMLCPFHADHSPSATLYTNTMRCWSKCNHTYGILDFMAKLGPGAADMLHDAEKYVPEEDIGEAGQKVIMFIGPED